MHSKKIGILCDIKEGKREAFFVYTDYVRTIEEAGAIPLLIPYNKKFSFLKIIDAVVLIGGGIYYNDNKKYSGLPLNQTNPKRYDYEKSIIQKCIKQKIPLVGICRGAEMICEVLGGEIRNMSLDKGDKHKSCHHLIRLKKGSIISKITQKDILKINSYHTKEIHLLPKSLIATSWAYDGVIESFESKNKKIIGFQFHPERLDDANIRNNIFRYFCKAV